MEDRITKIMEGYDPKALVLVSVEPEQEKTSLPGTPFIVSNTDVQDKLGKKAIKAIKVSLYTELQTLPSELKEVIELSTQDIGPKPTIDLNPLPSGYKDRQAVVIESVKDEVLGLFGDQARLGLYGVILVVAVIFLSMFILALLLVFAVRKNIKKMETSMASLISAVQDSAPSSGGPAMSAGPSQNSQGPASGSSDGENDLFSELSEASLMAMLTDCYWGEHDAYAAFIWARIPYTKKKLILEKIEFLEDYASFLTQVGEIDLALAQEPAYLNPLDILDVDNDTITEAVRENPGIINMLPTLRRDKLSLGAIERIEINRNADGEKVEQFPKLSSGPHRILKRISQIKVNSVDEEQQLLEMKDMDLDTKESIPSLIWMNDLSEDEIEQVLRPFNARDLAGAWIGPEETLEKMKHVLPPRKRELLESYIGEGLGSRDSTIYQEIHKASIALLRSRTDSAAAGSAEEFNAA